MIESTSSNIPPTIRSRYKMEESSLNPRHQQVPLKHHQNGNIHPHQQSLQTNEQLITTSNNRLPIPG
jgi:hypothetical protein